MNRATLLWHLQTIDREMDDNLARTREIDNALANDPTVATARAARDAAQKQLADLRATLTDRELEAQGLDAKIKELDARLYSGRVTNPKELDGLEKDSQMHKRLRSALDDKLLGLMDAVEQAQKGAAEKAHTLEQVESARAGDVERLSRERAALARRLDELNATRNQTRASLDADALRAYDRLRQSKAGRAVAQIKRDSCGTCGVSVPTGLASRVRAGEEIVVCPSCGRILAS